MNSLLQRTNRAILTPFAVLLLSASLQAAALDKPLSENVKTPTVINQITKSDNDDRSYRYLLLPNQVQVLLISDPKTEKSAAALDINIGSSEDPQDRPGLAHFLEHMLFLGTKKYPKTGEYQEYINAHSGSDNAYTSLDHTNFHFDIDPQYLEPALDRFAQFFIAPVMDEAYVERERNAVYSEYKAKIRDESRRRWDVLGELTNPANRSARFSVGTLETLSDTNPPGTTLFHKNKVRYDLVKFYENNYSANLMSLVILGKEPPDQLELMARKYFSDVANKKIELAEQEVPLFEKGFLPKKVYIKPLQEQRILSLSFPIPVFEHWYHEKPIAYIGYLLGHEGSGSVRDILRDKGWIESLEAGPDISNRQSASFTISVVMTQEGYRHQGEIIDVIYGSIDQLKSKGVEKWRYNEQAVINDTLFRFQEKGDALSYVSTLANNMHYYKPGDIISGMMVMSNYDETLIQRYLSYFKPENTLIEINAPDVPVAKTSHYYQSQYSVSPISDDDLKHWNKVSANDTIKLPNPNEYVAKQFRIKKGDESDTPADNPVLLRSNANLRLWFKQDRHFNVPKGGIYIYARSMQSTQGVQGAALTEIFVRLLKNNLNSSAYSAELAGLNLNLSRRSRGIEIKITGYNDKQGLLLTRALDAITSPTFRQKDFDSIKEQLLRELENQHSKAPYQQVNGELHALISKGEYNNNQYLAAVKEIQLAQVQAFSLSWLKSLNADILFHGNFAVTDVLKLSSIIDNRLVLTGASHPDPLGLFLNLPDSQTGFLRQMEVDHRDVAVMHYLQAADVTVAEQARMQMLAQLMETNFYQQLRTEQQLGYVVYASYALLGNVPGLVFLVQSPSYSAEDVDERITTFFTDFANTLATMPAKDFEQYRSALLKTIDEKPKNIGEEGAEFWGEITNRYLTFDLREQLIAQIGQLDQKTMADYYWKTFLSPNVHRVVVATSSKEKPLGKKLLAKYPLIDDLESFKNTQKYFVLK